MQLHVYKDPDEACHAVAAWICGLISKTLEVKEIFSWALSGGETPKKLYKLLAAEPYNTKIKWSRLHIFWGDERVVPFEDERNNAKMACENLLDKVDIPAEQVHKIWTDIDPKESAKQYEKLLHQYFDNKPVTFDLVLLGMGDDGHTLSIFPGSEIPDGQWVTVVHSKEKGSRITLLPSVVNRSASIAILVTGKNKAFVLQKVFDKPGSNEFPVQLIKPLHGEVLWFADEDAVQMLKG